MVLLIYLSVVVMPRKIVINCCYGGFRLSSEAQLKLAERGGMDEMQARYNAFGHRENPILVSIVEEMGDLASGRNSRLRIVEIPDDIEWEIEEYDGAEWVSEKHRTWF